MELRFNYAQLPYMSHGAEFDQNRLNWRCEMLLTRNQHLIKDKVVLDLACHNGRMSYPCLALGAKKVIGVEYRQSSIEEGIKYLEATEFKDKMEFVQADLLEYLTSARPGSFDTILCFGFLYHTVRQVDFFRQIARLAPEYVIIDTVVVKNYLWYGLKSLRNYRGRVPCLRVAFGDHPENWTDSTDADGITLWPTQSFLEIMFKTINYDYYQINYRRNGVKSWLGMEDYKKNTRVSLVAHRTS
jgi:SAM-dependent methyltransferase